MGDIRLDGLISALEDVLEARLELQQAESEYTGHSPSWALRSWHEAKEKAEHKFSEELCKVIEDEVEKAYARRICG